MKKMILILSFILFANFLEAADLHVSASKNVKAIMIEISELFEKKYPDWKVNLRTDKPAELIRLINTGTGTDFFLLSDEKRIRDLMKKKKVQNVKQFLADDLAIIGAATSKLEITEPGKLVFPELKGVALFAEKHPVGKAGREYLKKITLLDSLKDKILVAKNTKEVLKKITAGEADWGVVYNSDAIHAKGIKILWKIPQKEITSQIYFIGSVTGSPNQEGIRLFLETLNSTIAIKLFENSGLRVLKN